MGPRRLAVVAVVAAGACSTAPPTRIEPTSGAASTGAPTAIAPSAIAPTAEAPSAEAPIDPISPAVSLETAEAMLADADEEQTRDLEWLERVCRVGIARYPESYGPEMSGQVVVGCTCCAPFDHCPPLVGTPPEPREPGGVYVLRHRHTGSFTAPGRVETAATFFGCEPGSGNRGGTAILEERSGALTLEAYRSGVNPDQCEVLRAKDGRDLLACAWSDGQGSSGYTRIVTHDLGKEIEHARGFQEVEVLLTDGVCLLAPGIPYVDTRLQKMSAVDVDGDGRKDIRLEVLHRGGTISDRDMEACALEGELAYAPKTLAAPTPYRLDYVFDGVRLRPTAATRATMERLYRARAAFYSPAP